ncbi:hypothetical protein GGR31_001896 [Mesonia maritima]|uniref:NADH dehydrogenase subunit 6 n=1 Tax=Mesonia maritima TaxID=1793873 RepID=A0ABU1K6L2_9FLAO|nr:hypothetical protein [Mesonia maritima]
MKDFLIHFLYWLKVNLLASFLIILLTILLTFIADFYFLNEIYSASIYATLLVYVFILLWLFYLRRKSENQVLFDSVWITFLAGIGSILFPVIFQPKLCSGGYYIVPNRFLIITIISILILSSFIIGYRNKMNFILVGIFSFFHFLCLLYIIPFNYSTEVVNFIWKQFY